MNEREILQQEEVDFRKVIIRFYRAWPILLLSAVFCMLIALVFLKVYPPVFSAKTSFLIEKPKGVNDPGTIVSELATTKQIDDTYYRNQKIGFNVYPIVKRTVEELGLNVGYVRKGLMDADIYGSSPISVELDESYMVLERSQVPYSIPFYVTLKGDTGYEISAEGEYPVTEVAFGYDGEHLLGEWVNVDNVRFRVNLDSAYVRTYVGTEDFKENTYGFRINNVDAMSLKLMSTLEVSQAETDASIVEIRMQGASPSLLVDVLDKLGDLYIEDHLEVKTQVVSKAQEFLDAEIEKNLVELVDIENDIQSFKTRNESARLSEVGLLKNKESLDLENQKVSIMLKHRYYEYLKTHLSTNSDYSDLISPNAFGLKDPLITTLTKSLVEQNQEARAMEVSGTTANPRYQQLKANIESERNTILNTVEGFQESNRIASENIDTRISKMDVELADLPRVQRELQRLERLYRVNESLYNDLQKKRSSVALNMASITPDIRMIEPPFMTSLKPVFPNSKVVILMGLALGCILPLLFVLGKMVFNNSIDDEDDLTRTLTEIPVVGAVSNTTVRDFRDMTTFKNSRIGQQLGVIMYGLQKRMEDPQVILITSSKPNEGKSFLGALFAAKSGQMGKKTVVIDANIPDPKLHRYMGNENSEGLTQILSGDKYVSDVLQDTIHPAVKFISAGLDSRNSNLDVERLKALVDELRKEFDKIILDSSPLGLVAEVMELLQISDQTLIITRRSRTNFDDLKEIKDLHQDGLLPNTALVLTDTFDSGTKIHPFKKWNKYQQERGAGIPGAISRLFKRI